MFWGFFLCVYEEREDPSTTISGPSLNAGLVAAIFQGIRTCIARKPYILCFFRVGPDPLSLPHGGNTNFAIFAGDRDGTV